MLRAVRGIGPVPTPAGQNDPDGGRPRAPRARITTAVTAAAGRFPATPNWALAPAISAAGRPKSSP
jgi:hypothetical protein